jgi:hypothetical protein
MLTYVALDAGHEELVSIRLRVLDEVRRCLLSRNGNKRYTLIGRLEPNNLRTVDRTTRLVTLVTLPLAALSLLLLLGGSRRRAEKAERAREELPGHPLDDGNNVPGELWFDVVGDPRARNEHIK